MALKMSWVWKFAGAANLQRKVTYLEGVYEGFASYFREQYLIEPQLSSDRLSANQGEETGSATIDGFLVRRQRIQRILEQWTSRMTDIEYEELHGDT